MSIFIVKGKGCMWVVDVVKAEESKYIFPRSLLHATMQDGSIRERKVDEQNAFHFTTNTLIIYNDDNDKSDFD